MLVKIADWLHDNDKEITWFLLGTSVMTLFIDMGKNNYYGALFDVAIIGCLYFFRNRNYK